MSTYLKALKRLEESPTSRLFRLYKEKLNTFVNECFQQTIEYSPEFFGAFFDSLYLELSSPQSNKDSQYPEAEYWFIILRIILLYGLSSQAKNEFNSEKVHKFGLFLLQKILQKETSILNFHFLVLSAIFMVASLQQKICILESFYEESLQETKRPDLDQDTIYIILVLFYQFTCTRNNEFENLLREILFFSSDRSELCLPFSSTWLLGTLTLKKSFFKDISPPEWLKEELKPQLVSLSQSLNLKVSERIEDYMSHPNILGLIIYYNYLTSAINKDSFSMLPLVKDFEALKKSATKSTKSIEVIQANYEVLETFEAYDVLDNYSRTQYLVQLFLKFISLNTILPFENQPSLIQSDSKEMEANVYIKLWEDVLTLLEQMEEKLSAGIKNFLGQVLNRSEKFSNVITEEGSQLLSDFLLNVYFFSRYTYFNISPKLLSIKEDDSVGILIQCLTDVKDFEQNVEAKLEEFYKLHRAKDFNNFFLKLISFCFLPNNHLRRNVQTSQDLALNPLYDLVREIVILSVLKGEVLRLFTTLTKKIKDEHGKTLSNEPLNKIFVSCAEYLISNKGLSIDELPQIYQLFPFESQLPIKKFYFRLFIEIKKYSYLMKNLHIFYRFQSEALLSPVQTLKIGKILQRLFTHITINEFSNSISKIGFMALLQISQNEVKVSEPISFEFLNWLQVAVGLNALQGVELIQELLTFFLSYLRPFPSVKQLLSRDIDLKKNIAIPYLLSKSSLSLLELFSKLGSGPALALDEDINGKEGDQGGFAEGSEAKGPNIAESLSLILSKKIVKKGAFNKTGKKKIEVPSKRKSKEAQDAKLGDDSQKQGTSQLQQAKVQDLAAQLYEYVTDSVLKYFEIKDNLRHFEGWLASRFMTLPYDIVTLKRDFEGMMEVESELKYEDLYILLAQNEFAYLQDFIDLLQKNKVQNETDKVKLDKNLDILASMINVMLRCLLQKIKKVKRAGMPYSIEMKNAAGLFNNTLEKLKQMLFKNRELTARPPILNETISDFLTFVCENNTRDAIDPEVSY